MSDQSKNQAAYQAIGQAYQEHPLALWPEMYELKNLVPRGRVLDLGCGDGRAAELFRNDSQIQYLGIDSSPAMITAAQQRFSGAQNIQFTVGDMLELPQSLTPSPFSLILLIGSYHHILGRADRRKLLQDLKDILANDGHIVLTVWNIYHPKIYRRFSSSLWRKITSQEKNRLLDVDFLFKTPEKTLWRTYHLFFPRQLKKEIEQAGFIITEKAYWHKKHNLVFFLQKKRG